MPDVAAPAGPPLDVLVVEDNEINRFLMRRYLESAGHAVTEAVDGEEGVQRAVTHRFDVILMDISMPRMGGVEATRRIRSEGASKHSRILALTAHALPDELSQFRDAGMEATLTKPISRQDLLAILTSTPDDPGTGTAPQTGNLSAAVDRTALRELRAQIGAAAAAALVKRLIVDGDETMALIRVGPLHGRQQAIADRCHQLAGTGGAFGTVRLREALVVLQDRLKHGDMDGIDADLTRLDRLWSETRAILSEDAERMASEVA